VKELDVVPIVTPAPASAPETAPTAPTTTPESAPAPAPVTKPSRNKHRKGGSRSRRSRGVTLRGRITYRLSRPGLVRVVLRRSHGRPLVFMAEQNAGRKRVPLAKLVGARRLARGRYNVSVVAYSLSGSHSRARHHGFRVVPRASGKRR
jgi:hypothetical protein